MPTTVTISTIQVMRSTTPGARPVSLLQGQEFVNFADKIRLIGLGGSSFVTVPLNITELIAEAIQGKISLVDGKVPLTNIPDLPASRVTTGTFGADRIPTLDAGKIGSGVLDPARIPPIGSAVVASGDLTTLTVEQQAQITTGVHVITSDGVDRVYRGTGSKTVAGSYTIVTSGPIEYSTIQNAPILGDAALKNTGTAAGTVAAGNDSRITSAVSRTELNSDLATKADLVNGKLKAEQVVHPAAQDITDATTTGRALLKAADAAAGRTALALGNSATRAVGTAAGTVAAGDDNRFKILADAAVELNIVTFGGDPTGVADSSDAYDAAFAALPARGGTIFYPVGKFRHTRRLVKTLPTSGKFVTIRGASEQYTVLSWSAVNGGMQFLIPNGESAVAIRDISFVTSVPSGGEAIVFESLPSYSGSISFGVGQPFSLNNVTTRADPPQPLNGNYWSTGFRFKGLTYCNISQCSFNGGSNGEFENPSHRYGLGIAIEGYQYPHPTSGASVHNYSLIMNVDACVFNGLDIGLYYGAFVQGVSVVNSNAVYCRVGIGTIGQADNPSGSDLAQLYIANYQYGLGTGNAIELNAVCFTTSIVNSTFFVKSNRYGIYSPYPVPFNFSNLNIQGEGHFLPAGTIVVPGSNGIYLGPSQIDGGTIVGCTFNAVGTGILCGASRILADNCNFIHTPNTIVDSGQSNYWGMNLTAHSFASDNTHGLTVGSMPPVRISPTNHRLPSQGSRPLYMQATNSGGGRVLGIIVTDASGNMLFRTTDAAFNNIPSSVFKVQQGVLAADNALTVGTTINGAGQATFGSMMVSGNVGFFGTSPTSKPTVTGQLNSGGAAGTQAVIANTLNALQGLGLLVNGTTY